MRASLLYLAFLVSLFFYFFSPSLPVLFVGGLIVHFLLAYWVLSIHAISFEVRIFKLVLFLFWLGCLIFSYPDLLVFHSDLFNYGNFSYVKSSLLLLQAWEIIVISIVYFSSKIYFRFVRTSYKVPDAKTAHISSFVLNDWSIFLVSILGLLLYFSFFSPSDIFGSRLTGYKGSFLKIPLASDSFYNIFISLNVFYSYIASSFLAAFFLRFSFIKSTRFKFAKGFFLNIYFALLSVCILFSSFASQVRTNLLLPLIGSLALVTCIVSTYENIDLIKINTVLRLPVILFVSAILPLLLLASELQSSSRGVSFGISSRGFVQSDPNLYAFSEILLNTPFGGSLEGQLSFSRALLSPFPSFLVPFKSQFNYELLSDFSGTVFSSFAKPITNTSIAITSLGEFTHAFGPFLGLILSVAITSMSLIFAFFVISVSRSYFKPRTFSSLSLLIFSLVSFVVFLPRSFSHSLNLLFLGLYVFLAFFIVRKCLGVFFRSYLK